MNLMNLSTYEDIEQTFSPTEWRSCSTILVKSMACSNFSSFSSTTSSALPANKKNKLRYPSRRFCVKQPTSYVCLVAPLLPKVLLQESHSGYHRESKFDLCDLSDLKINFTTPNFIGMLNDSYTPCFRLVAIELSVILHRNRHLQMGRWMDTAITYYAESVYKNCLSIRVHKFHKYTFGKCLTIRLGLS